MRNYPKRDPSKMRRFLRMIVYLLSSERYGRIDEINRAVTLIY